MAHLWPTRQGVQDRKQQSITVMAKKLTQKIKKKEDMFDKFFYFFALNGYTRVMYPEEWAGSYKPKNK